MSWRNRRAPKLRQTNKIIGIVWSSSVMASAQQIQSLRQVLDGSLRIFVLQGAAGKLTELHRLGEVLWLQRGRCTRGNTPWGSNRGRLRRRRRICNWVWRTRRMIVVHPRSRIGWLIVGRRCGKCLMTVYRVLWLICGIVGRLLGISTSGWRLPIAGCIGCKSIISKSRMHAGTTFTISHKPNTFATWHHLHGHRDANCLWTPNSFNY